jgi:hypothetical protein
VHLGWLNNYYYFKIEDVPYQPVVYGAAFSFGFELSETFLILDLSMMVDPGFLILKPETHPYYREQVVYFAPSIGLGINLYDLNRIVLSFRKKSDLPEDKKTRLYIQEKQTMLEDSLEIDRQKKRLYAQMISSHCKTSGTLSVAKKMVREKDGTIYAGQQIGETTFIIIKVPGSKMDPTVPSNVFTVDSTQSLSAVYVYEAGSGNENLSDIFNGFREGQLSSSSYQAVQGKIVVSYNYHKNQLSLHLSDLKLNKNTPGVTEDIYYDDIYICEVCGD